MSTLANGANPIRVLDRGGGTGTSAVPLAEAGAEVTVVDVSADALAILARRAAEAGVSGRVRPVQGDIEALADVVEPGVFDLVLLHGVLDAVDHDSALSAARATVRPLGLVSIVIANPVAGVIARLISGEVDSALDELRADLRGDRLGSAALGRACAANGLIVEATHGLGVFAEFTPAAVTDATSAADSLRALEDLAGELSPYRELAARVHMLARRPASN